MILANGCSFTEGYYLNSLDLAWPFQLGEQLNCSTVNLAQGGGSNQRIFRTTLDYLTKHTPEYLIIGWTDVNRFELPICNGTYARINSNNVLYHEQLKSNPPPKLLQEIYYKYLHNSYLNTDLLLTYILTIQDLCSAKNIKYLSFNAFSPFNINEVLTDYHEYYKYEQSQLDSKLVDAYSQLNNKLSKINNFLHLTMSEYCRGHQAPLDSGGHPTELGHRLFSEYVFTCLTKTIKESIITK